MYNEDFYNPNMSIGFDSQGTGSWIKGSDRYEMLSKGFYFVMSKNFFVSGGKLGTFGVHIGTNYCVTEDNDNNLNAFLGNNITSSKHSYDGKNAIYQENKVEIKR
jgi:hypothetical protein